MQGVSTVFNKQKIAKLLVLFPTVVRNKIVMAIFCLFLLIPPSPSPPLQSAGRAGGGGLPGRVVWAGVSRPVALVLERAVVLGDDQVVVGVEPLGEVDPGEVQVGPGGGLQGVVTRVLHLVHMAVAEGDGHLLSLGTDQAVEPAFVATHTLATDGPMGTVRSDQGVATVQGAEHLVVHFFLHTMRCLEGATERATGNGPFEKVSQLVHEPFAEFLGVFHFSSSCC